jgi:hypothetical protein
MIKTRPKKLAQHGTRKCTLCNTNCGFSIFEQGENLLQITYNKLIKPSGNAVMTIKTFTSTTTLEELRSKDNVR